MQNLIPISIFPNSFLLNKKLTSQQKVLFEILCAYDNIDNTHKGWAEVSIDQLSEDMSLEKRSIQLHLKTLITMGMVTVVYRNNRSGGNRTSIYILNVLPSISEEDRQHIATHCTVEVKSMLSGLNTIKVQTSTGIVYTSLEEFDLEYLITNKRSSEIIDGDILTDFETIPGSEVSKVLKPTIKVTASGKKLDNKPKKKLTPEELCDYYKDTYTNKYKEFTKVGDKTDLKILSKLLTEYPSDFVQELISVFIQYYDSIFSSRDYPRPKIYAFSQQWMLTKILDKYYSLNQVDEEIPKPKVKATDEVVVFM